MVREKLKRLSVETEAGAESHEAQKKGQREEPQTWRDIEPASPSQEWAHSTALCTYALGRYVCDATSASFRTVKSSTVLCFCC